MTYTLHCADALDFMRGMDAASVDCVFVDLPYFEIVNEDWDNQWRDRAEYIAWVVELAHEWKSITKDNSSIFIFCDEKMEAYIQVALDEIFLLLNKIVWFKPNNLPQKNAHKLRTFAPMTERALFYTTQYDSTGWEAVKLDVNNFVPLRNYFRDFQAALGLTIKRINTILGHRKAEHAFYWNSTQWDLPTPETYRELLELPRGSFSVREYEDLRREYEDLRRPFNADVLTWDVIEWPIVSSKDNTAHPTTKPLGLCKRLISVITNPGQTVLDCCAGSGTTGVACIELGRNFIGVELDPRYYAIAQERCARAALQPPLLVESQPEAELEQGELWNHSR